MNFRTTMATLAGLAFFGFMLVVGAEGIAQIVSRPTTPVLVQLPDGHGTGVYIGNGRVLTAAHVTEGHDVVTVVTADGQKQAAPVEWQDLSLDVAIVKVHASTLWAGAKINCNRPAVGTEVTAIGYVYNFGRLQTWGRVAGDVADLTVPAKNDFLWPEVIAVGVPGGPGMSGGPLFDATGELRGIVVGGGGPYTHPIMIAVPSSAICRAISEHEKVK